jgi:nitrogen-specific signal transduction histidine kinase
VRLHRQSFIEALLNLVRNAQVHGFPGDCSQALLVFRISERRKRIVIDYTNNGRPFPENISAKDFLTFGRKSNDSPGEGLGGAWIGKAIAAHNGSFEIIRDEHPLHFRIMLPKGGI